MRRLTIGGLAFALVLGGLFFSSSIPARGQEGPTKLDPKLQVNTVVSGLSLAVVRMGPFSKRVRRYALRFGWRSKPKVMRACLVFAHALNSQQSRSRCSVHPAVDHRGQIWPLASPSMMGLIHHQRLR